MCDLCGMAYHVIKTINGKKYSYLQESYRVGKKVKTRSKYLGRYNGTVPFNCYEPAFDVARELARQEQERQTEKERIANFEKTMGVTLGSMNPTPIDKSCERTPNSPAAAETEKSSPEGS